MKLKRVYGVNVFVYRARRNMKKSGSIVFL